jgi:hypothetical protein
MNRFSSLALLIALAFSLARPFALPVAAATISGAASRDARPTVALPITDIQISGASGTVPVKLLVTNGSLAMSTTTGLTFTGDQTGAELYFSGTLANVNAALATLTYTRASEGSDTLEVSLVEPGEVFFEGNGHLYEYIAVGGGITWANAQTAAAALERYGSTGYLATITSAQENAFVAARLEGAGWMGASDSAVEDTWRWVTGPETGTAFWQGDQSGAVVEGSYANWDSGEPNDSAGIEDCAQFLAGGGQNGKWNDLRCTGTTLSGYVVEFGAPGDMPDVSAESFTINTYDPPVADTFLPVDDATDVERDDNLYILFDQDVVVETGFVSLYRAGGALFEQFDVTGPKVTGNGTDMITLNPASKLPPGASMYVTIDATAFDALDGGSYAGISNATTWNFRTAGTSSAPIASPPTLSTTLSSVVTNCAENSVSGVLTLSTTNANQYMLSAEPFFLQSAYQTFSGGEISVPFSLLIHDSTPTLYVAARGEAASAVTASLSVPVDSCDVEVEELVLDQPIVPEEPLDDEGLLFDSPWNDVMEPVTDTAGMTLIRGANYDTVYMLEDGVRRPFMTEAIYFTWFSDFSGVHEVTNATLQVIPLGPPMLPKNGSLIKIMSVPAVYEVMPHDDGQTLRHIPTEYEAAQQFGVDWMERVIDLDVTLFRRFIFPSDHWAE